MEINLVLSGGGARGLAHLGIIKAIRENGILIKRISGVSTGAVVGAFTAAGFSPEETLKIFMENKLMYQIRPVFNAGLFGLNKWEKILMKYFPGNSFEELSIPLTVIATDINNCESVYFSSGELVKPLLASCSIPGFFEPVLLNQRQLVDGGVLNNLPVEPFLRETEKIVALHVNPIVHESEIDSALKIFERSVQLSIRENTDNRKKLAHLNLEPEALYPFQLFDLKDAEEIFNIGYAYAKGCQKEFEKL